VCGDISTTEQSNRTDMRYGRYIASDIVTEAVNKIGSHDPAGSYGTASRSNGMIPGRFSRRVPSGNAAKRQALTDISSALVQIAVD